MLHLFLQIINSLKCLIEILKISRVFSNIHRVVVALVHHSVSLQHHPPQTVHMHTQAVPAILPLEKSFKIIPVKIRVLQNKSCDFLQLFST